MTAILKPPLIGALRRRLVLEALDATPDGSGGLAGTWSPVAVLWAAIHPRHGSERFAADGTEGHITHDIWVRPRNDIRPGRRLRLDTRRLFDIRAVLIPDPFVPRMRLICEELNL